MITFYSKTELIVGFLGLYMVAAGLSMLGKAKKIEAIMVDLKEGVGLRYLTGVFVFAIGAFVVSVHSLWASPLQILASLLGWAALAEGMLLIAAGRSFLRSFDATVRHPRFIRIVWRWCLPWVSCWSFSRSPERELFELKGGGTCHCITPT